MKLGIIIGSIRDGRRGAAVGEYVHRIAARREGVEVELLDLKRFDLPLITSAVEPMDADKQYDDPAVTAWSRAVDACDGFVFVTPEYNHSVPGPFKNAVDALGREWVGKPVGLVGYGGVGGVRAIQHWRLVVANFSMPAYRGEASFTLNADWDDDRFAPLDRREREVERVLEAVEKLVKQTRG